MADGFPQMKFKKGDYLYKEGDPETNIYLIKEGKVSQCSIKGKKTFEIFQVGQHQVVGEYIIAGNGRHVTSAICTTETEVIAIPIENINGQIDKVSPVLKMFLKAIIEKILNLTLSQRAEKIEKDEVPCPDEDVAKVFGAIYFTMLKRGKKEADGSYNMDWTFLKSYCRRVFEESPLRIENAVNILVKLKLAKYEMGKLPDKPKGPDVILKLHINQIDTLDAFFEFYQHYFFSPGKAQLLQIDDISYKILEAIVEEAAKSTPDRMGKVSVDYKVIAENYNGKMSNQLVPTQIQALDTKGVFCKLRNTTESGVKVEFDKKELSDILTHWRIIREIQKWNTSGRVDPQEQEVKQVKKVMTEAKCPSCKALVLAEAKFCHVCGAKV